MSPNRNPSRFAAAPLALCLLALALPACESNVVAPTPATDAGRLYWELALDHRAITLAMKEPYDTITLTATPRNGLGEPLAGAPAVTFTSSDFERVFVGEDGVVRALKPGAGIIVKATLTVGNATHVDSAIVNVVEVVDGQDPPRLASLSATPEAPDSAKDAVGGDPLLGYKMLPVRALDADGAPIEGLAVHFATSDPKVATIGPSTGMVTGLRPGGVTFYASATAFGVRMVDTIPFTIGYPLSREIYVRPSLRDASVGEFSPQEVRIGVGGVVMWYNYTGMATDMTLEDPAAAGEDPLWCEFFNLCGSGNIEPFGPPPGDPDFSAYLRVRKFSTPGVYRFRSTVHGTTGTVIVGEPSESPSMARAR